MYSFMLAYTVLPSIVTVHKRVEMEMEDGSKPPHKFTDLCREFMGLDAPDKDGKAHTLFKAIMPNVSGQHAGSATVTYRSDTSKAVDLAKKIRHSPPAWFFGYWTRVRKYKLSMVQKLMESFDLDSALLAHFAVFDTATLTVQTEYGDTDEHLENIEADLGIHQGWAADSEIDSDTRIDVVGHREALSMTLRDRVEDIEDAARSGPSRRLDFSQSTGNSTNHSEATTRLHI